MSFIEFERITKEYRTGKEGVQALQNISGSISSGEFVMVTGPSGSGKSTLLTILGGLNRPSEGSLNVDGLDVYSLSQESRADFRREYIGFVFQSFQLVPYLTVFDNVQLPLAIMDIPVTEKRSMAMEVIDRVGLDSKVSRLPDELSGGEQQRVAIARSLVNHPPIILADEPTGNLDTTTSKEILDLIKSFKEQGHTCVMVTHNPENLKYATRCLTVRDGKIDDSHPDNGQGSSIDYFTAPFQSGTANDVQLSQSGGIV